jgi:CTP:molybdopterin cytidylyltransferase MocA
MLKQVLKFSAQHPDAICQPVSGGHTRHPVILPRTALTELRNPDATTLKDFLKLTTLPRVQFEVNDAGLSLDMDTPEDYKRLTAFQ